MSDLRLRSLRHDSFLFILLLAMVTGLQALCTTLMLPALPAIAQSFGVTSDTAQFTVSGFLAGLASGQLLLGALSDRYGRRPILLSGLALSVAAGAGCVFAPGIHSLIALRIVQGFGAATGMIVGRAIVRDLFHGQRALKVMSTLVGMMTIFPMVGPPLSGLLLHWLSWRGIFGLIASIGLVLGILTWLCIAESLQRPDAASTDPRRILRNCLQVLRTPECLSFILVGCISYGSLWSFLTIIPFVARDSFGLSAAETGAMLALTPLAGWVGTRFSHRISGRWPVRRILWLSTGLGLGSGIVLLAVTLLVGHGLFAGKIGILTIMLPMMVNSMASGVTHPITIVMYLEPMPKIAGTVSAVGATCQTLSGALFGWLAAALYDGTPAALGYGVTLATAGAFVIFTLRAQRYLPRLAA